MTTTHKPAQELDPQPEIAAPGAGRPSGWQSSMRGLFQRGGAANFGSRYALVGVWLILTLFYIVDESDVFFTSGTFQTIFGSQQAYVFLGMAAVITFAVGEFDLTIAANMAFAAVLVPVLVVEHGWPEWLAALAALSAVTGIGAVTALIVVRMAIDPIITTLGMSTLIGGVATKITGGNTVSGLSDDFASVANTQLIFDLPISFYYGLALVCIIAYVMRFTALGRHMAFVGANREVARLAGVRVGLIRGGSYVISAFLCGLGGVILVASLGGFDASTATGYLLPALSATFLGTAAIRPGRFNPLGTFVAIYFLVTGIVGLQLMGAASWVSDVFYGGALIIAVVISTLARRRALAGG
jgi:ribose transport system permease protein